MLLPNKEQFTDANIKHSEIRRSLGQMVDILKSTEKASLSFDNLESLKECRPFHSNIKAKDLSTGRVYAWIRSSEDGVNPPDGTWIDTQSSEYEHSKKLLQKKLSSTMNGGSIENLFEFSDLRDKPVVAIDATGDIKNPDYSFNDIGGKTELAHDFIEAAKKANIQNTMQKLQLNEKNKLFEFSDLRGKPVVSVTDDGDIIFNGGISLKDSTQVESKTHITAKEYIDDSFIGPLMSGLAFNNATRSNLFEGAVKQQFTIKNESDFLNLKISQSVPINIDTPYFEHTNGDLPQSQVVHPYVCTFKNSVHGFKHILLATPFHNTNDLYENPCVWGSNDLNEFELLDKFDQPLAEFFPTGSRNYNSDNAAIYDHTTGEYVVLFRNSESTESGLYNRHYLMRTQDFINFSKPIKMLRENGGDLSGSTLNLSPTILYNPTLKKWVMYQVDWEGAAQGFSYRTSDHLEHGWSVAQPISTNPNMQPWHCEVRYCGQHYIAIINDINGASNAVNGFGDLFIGISSDGVNFNWSESIFDASFDNPYKATITHEIVGNSVKFHILWTSNGNEFTGWRLYHSETQLIEVI